VLVFIGMTSASLAESCQGDRTQRQRSALKLEKITVEVRSVWHDIYVVTARCCVLPRAPAQERGTYAAMHKYYHHFSANKQKRDAQTSEQGGSAVIKLKNSTTGAAVSQSV
jgi:hypothetical protein